MVQDAFAEGVVAEIIDGDTFTLAGPNLRIRLSGTDSPETSGPASAIGDKATAALSGMMPVGSKVRLKNRLIGKYGRTVAGVELISTPPGKKTTKIKTNDIVVEMVRLGWAVPDVRFMDGLPFSQQKLLRNAVIEARENKAGMWGEAERHPLLETINPSFPSNITEIEEIEGPSRIPGATKIGTIWLYVPPAQITITERNSNIDFPTVRTPGTPKLKSSEQEQRIEISVIFPNLWAINYQFRAILAQFIRTPFLPLENEHIRDLLLPSYILPGDDINLQLGISEEEQSRVANLAAQKKLAEEKRVGEPPAPAILPPLETTTIGRTTPTTARVDSLTLFVALRNMVVSTVPSIPQAIQVTFVMSVYNYLPHTTEIEYLTAKTDIDKQIKYLNSITKMRFPDQPNPDLSNKNDAVTTTDISRCEPFKRYYKNLLAESVMNVEEGGLTWGQGITPRLFAVDEKNMSSVAMEIDITKLSNDEVGNSRDEIRALQAAIGRQIRRNIGLGIRSADPTFTSTTVDRLFGSIQGLLNIITEKMFEQLPQAVSNLETAQSTNDLLAIKALVNADPRMQGILNSTKTVLLDRETATAQDVIDAAVNGAFQADASIIASFKRIFQLEHLIRYGKEEVFDVSLKNGNSTVISGFSASMSPKVALVPILEHMNPSMQYMGKSDWVVSLNLQTADQDLMRRLMHMSQLARVTRMVRESSGNRWFSLKLNSIRIAGDGTNNGMFGLLGIGHVLIEDFVYESIKDKPGWFNLSLRMVQADLDISEYERLIPTNVLGDGVVTQIIRNISRGSFNSRSSQKIVQTVLRSIRQASRQIPFLIGSSTLTLDQIDQQLDDNSIQRRLLTSLTVTPSTPPADGVPQPIPNPGPSATGSKDSWREAVQELFGPGPFSGRVGAALRGDTATKVSSTLGVGSTLLGVARLFRGGSAKSSIGLAVVGSAPIVVKLTRAQYEFRLNQSRQIFRAAIGAAIREGIAKDPEGMLELYDPALAASTDKDDRGSALRLLSFTDSNKVVSFLHGCYPDLELPIFGDNPLATSPDFFYKKNELLPMDSADIVRTRLNNIFNTIADNFGVGKSVPGDAISDIRLVDMYRNLTTGGRLKSLLDDNDELVSLEKVIVSVNTEIEKAAEGALGDGGRNPEEVSDEEFEQQRQFAKARLFGVRTEKEIREFIARLNVDEFVTISSKERLAVHKLSLIMGIATAQDKILRGELADPSITKKKLRNVPTRTLRNIQDSLLSQLRAISLYGADNGDSILDGAWGAVTPTSLRINRLLLDKTMAQQVNRARGEGISGSLARSYPTAKIYFIEEDSRAWGMFDDYYSYSAIRSIQVASAKDSASKVATIQLSNITQRLTDNRPQRGENPLKDQTHLEQTINSLFLREGMTIMLRMGYSNDPNLLERTFMGKIVSVTAGDVIQIVAQSFGAELTAPVFNSQKGKHGYLGTARSHGDVVALALGSVDGLDHFGNKSWLERLNIKDSPFSQPEFEGLAYSTPKYRKWDYWISLVNPLPLVVKFGVYDPRLENVYLPYSGIVFSPVDVILEGLVNPIIGPIKRTFNANKKIARGVGDAFSASPRDTASTISQGIFEHGRNVYNGLVRFGSTVFTDAVEVAKNGAALTTNVGFDWFYNNTTLWKLLNEISLYHNDYIVTTLPYNDDIWGWQRETLYVGPRNGFYKYTERFDDPDVVKRIFAKNKKFQGLPVGFKRGGLPTQTRMTRKKMAQDRGFDDMREGRAPVTPSRRSSIKELSYKGPPNTEYLATGDEVGQVVQTSYNLDQPSVFDPEIRKFGHFVIIRTPGNDSRAASQILHEQRNPREITLGGQGLLAEKARRENESIRGRLTSIPKVSTRASFTAQEALAFKQSIRSYTIIYNLRNPKELPNDFRATEAINNVLDNRQIGIGDTIGLHKSGSGTKQIFFVVGADSSLEASGRNWIGVNMVEIMRKRNVTDVTVTGKEITAEEKRASKFLVNINNPYHLLDEQNEVIQGYTPVQQYHWIDSRHDIIENAITASAEGIHNKVTIRFPGDPGEPPENEFTVVADDNIRAGHIRHLVSEQQNIDPTIFEDIIGLFKQRVVSSLIGRVASATPLPMKYVVSSNLLGNEMRPMYRGAVKIWGRPSIRPFDIVYMNDQVNQMTGPFEVAEVIHDYNSENGFTTTLVPSAVITVRDQSRVYQQLAMGGLVLPYFDRSMSDMIGSALEILSEPLESLFVDGQLPAREEVEPIASAVGQVSLVAGIPFGGIALARLIGKRLKRFLIDEAVSNTVQHAKDTGQEAVSNAKRAAKGVKKKLPKKTRDLLKKKAAIAKTRSQRIFGKFGTFLRSAQGSKSVGAARGIVGGGARFVGMSGGTLTVGGVLALMAVNNLWHKGVAKVMGRDIITVSGLFYNGQPFIAGMEGAYKDSYTVHFMEYVEDLFTFSGGQEDWSHGEESEL